MKTKAISVKELHFSYDETPILKDISMDVPKEKFIAILGPNGSGKTTYLKNLSKLLKPHRGEIEIEGESIRHMHNRDLAKKMSVVHQGTDVNFEFTCFEVVLMGRFPYLKRFQSESLHDVKIAEDAMIHTGTLHLRDKGINQISGGERQRVLIAKALTQQTPFLLLDEPISHLDIKYQLDILSMCESLVKEDGLTVVATLHDINMACRFADEIILLKEGRVVAKGTPSECITEATMKDVYGIDVHITSHPELGNPMIIPR